MCVIGSSKPNRIASHICNGIRTYVTNTTNVTCQTPSVRSCGKVVFRNRNCVKKTVFLWLRRREAIELNRRRKVDSTRADKITG